MFWLRQVGQFAHERKLVFPERLEHLGFRTLARLVAHELNFLEIKQPRLFLERVGLFLRRWKERLFWFGNSLRFFPYTQQIGRRFLRVSRRSEGIVLCQTLLALFDRLEGALLNLTRVFLFEFAHVARAALLLEQQLLFLRVPVEFVGLSLM